MKYLKTIFTLVPHTEINKETLSTARDICAALAGYAGYESFEETENGINGYVQKNLFQEKTLDTLLKDFPLENVNVTFHTEEAEDRNWNEEWENKGFEPISIGGRCVIHDSHHVPEPCPIDIEIDAKLAFGTGIHNTTHMIVEQLLELDLKGKSVLDCGCGTGILSITASKCGAEEIVGYDIDEWSVENTIHNAQINKVGNIKTILGNADALKDLKGKFNVVLANINRNILIEDMPVWARFMVSGCDFIVSGFYHEDVIPIKEKAASLGLEFVREKQSEEWSMLHFKKTYESVS